MLKKEAKVIAHTLSNPSKMPGKAYGLPAAECRTGGALRACPGSVCSKCYAHNRGMYAWRSTVAAQYKRLASIQHVDWVSAMVALVQSEKWFRWHDSGDVQSLEHLRKIVQVCRMTPETRYWLPTKEKAIVRQFVREYGAFPENLCVRVSAAMVDGRPPAGFANTSTTVTSAPTCPAYRQGGECGDCRACWDKDVANVAYPLH